MSVDLSKHGMKNFPGLNLTRSNITCFVQFAKNIPLFVTRGAAFLGIDGSSFTCFRRDTLVSHSHSVLAVSFSLDEWILCSDNQNL